MSDTSRVGIGIWMWIGVAIAGPAETPVYDNGDPAGGFGVAILSEQSEHNQVADHLTLATDATVSGFEWWGTGEGDRFRLRLFRIVGGLPESVPRVDLDLGPLVGVPENYGAGPVSRYSMRLPPTVVPAGSYAVSVVEQGEGVDWFWSASCEDGCEGGSFRRADDADDWSVGNWEMAFRLLGPTPGFCPDLDGSGAVDFADLVRVVEALGPCVGCPEDLTCDGIVDADDLLLLADARGPCP